jgi:uncharacterized membrane protein YphA (DoxX/SURF4 family)
MDYNRPTHVPSAGLVVRDAGLLILRWCAGTTLLLLHAWEESIRGWKHVWHKEPWAFAVEITERGFLFPEVVAAAAVVVALLGCVFLISGLLCRFFSLLLLACALCGLFLYGRMPEIAERLALYAGIYAVLLICGPGRFSLDALLSHRRSLR